jgi:hypothetical protein
MSKYRRLNSQELHSLEKKFIQFLVANTITGDDWLKIKTSNPTRAEGLIDIFSDLVFEETLKKVEYLKMPGVNDLKVFHCTESSIRLLGISIESDGLEIDFSKPHHLKEIIEKHPAAISIYSLDKKNTKTKEEEAFFLMEQGCLITDKQEYEILNLLNT